MSAPVNILVIWGEDVGAGSLSCYAGGLTGHRTPHLDRLAADGVRFTDAYGERSGVAGRAAFLTGQSGYRTGLTASAAEVAGLSADDPTVAALLRERGYATGQFGRDHLGDHNEHLPTRHGFDEFFGSPLPTRTVGEPELPDYPEPERFPGYRARFGPRGVLRCRASGVDDVTVDPRWGRVGPQIVEDTGPLTAKRMRTCDDEFVQAAGDWISRQHSAGKPFFCWVTLTRSRWEAPAWPGAVVQDAIRDHDRHVGDLLRLLDELGLSRDTLVVYSSDRGPRVSPWPDGAVPHGGRDPDGDGAYRVPLIVRWPDRIAAGTVSHDLVQHQDWLPTLLAAAGENDVSGRLRTARRAHLDGYNVLPYLLGEVPRSPRPGFLYVDDHGDVVALRFGNWKVVFLEQRVRGAVRVWAEHLVAVRHPQVYNVRTDGYERAVQPPDTFDDWVADHRHLVLAGRRIVTDVLATFRDFPPRRAAAVPAVERALVAMDLASTAGRHRRSRRRAGQGAR